MLAAAAAVFKGQAGASSTYIGRVLGHGPDWYLPLGDPMATAQVGASGTYQNSPQLGVDPIAQDDSAGKSVGLSGAATSPSHITVSSPLSAASCTIHLLVQLDSITKSKHVLITTGGGPALGDFSLEVLANGQIRAWSEDGIVRQILGTAGDVPQGEAVSVVYQRQSDVAGWSQRVYVNGALKAEDTVQRTWPSLPSQTWYIGAWSDLSDATDGLIAHVAGWNSLLTPIQISDLARANSVAWAEDIDAGAVQASQSKGVSVRQGGWHGKLPLIAAAGDGSLVTTTESGEDVTVLAGSTTGENDTFTFSFTDATGKTSPTRTVTIDVTAAPAGVSIGALTAFQSSRIQVTALPGWPGGRTPKGVVTQGMAAHGYVRRSWKPTDNDGTWMDFQAGWRKTLTADVIRIELDDDSELDLLYTVDLAIPAPGVGGVTRTLDKLGGADFTAWTSAIAGLSDNDVLVVRARAGGEVYPIDLNAGGATSTASGVKVVAHPDDLAAGRRPRIHVQGTRFARYADELNAGHWEVHADLGAPHGKVWKSTNTIANPVNVGCSYRSKGGGLRRCFTYTNTPGTPGAMARLLDTTYPRIDLTDPSEWALYMGPGVYWNALDERLYIRLSSLRAGVGAIQVDAAAGLGPNPPWDWSDDDPENEDPNQCQLFISSTNDQNSPGNVTVNSSYCLRINGETDWVLENLDFVGGGNTIEMRDGSGHTLRGCRFLGWAPPNMQDSPTQSTIGQVHNMLECENTFGVLADRCEFWGGACPWVGWDENKGRHGAYSIPQKCNLWWMQAASGVESFSGRFVNCLADGFLTVTRPGGKPVYVKFHQCSLRYWGMDGSVATEPPTESLEYIRTQIFEGTFAGWVGASALDGNQYVGYCLINNFRPYMHENGWWDVDDPSAGNQWVCGSQIVGHEDYRDCKEHYYYNNTAIGAHNHRRAQTTKVSGGMVADGAGAFIFPYNLNRSYTVWMSRNNVQAVFPNGSFGNSIGTTGGPSGDSHVGVVLHPDHVGNAVGGTYSQDYNIYHRAAGMPAVNNDGVVTTVSSSGTGQAEAEQNDIITVRSVTGQETNGDFDDPEFVGSWGAAKLDGELHSNAFWCLQSGSPAASGGDTTGRAWPDLDFATVVSYGGNSWRGCMDPAASAVEQQVGPLGPVPSEL